MGNSNDNNGFTTGFLGEKQKSSISVASLHDAIFGSETVDLNSKKELGTFNSQESNPQVATFNSQNQVNNFNNTPNNQFNNTNNGVPNLLQDSNGLKVNGFTQNMSNTQQMTFTNSLSNTQQMNFNQTVQGLNLGNSTPDIKQPQPEVPTPSLNNNQQMNLNNSVPSLNNTQQMNLNNTQQLFNPTQDLQSIRNTNNMHNTQQMNLNNTQQMNLNNTQQMNLNNTQQISLNNTQPFPPVNNQPMDNQVNMIPSQSYDITGATLSEKKKVNVTKILNISSMVILSILIVFVVLYSTGVINFKKAPKANTNEEVVVDPEEQKVERMVSKLNAACNNLDAEGNYGSEPALADETCNVITCYIVNNAICANGLCMISDGQTVYSKVCRSGSLKKVNANDFQANVNLGELCTVLDSNSELNGNLEASYGSCKNFECQTVVAGKSYTASCQKNS